MSRDIIDRENEVIRAESLEKMGIFYPQGLVKAKRKSIEDEKKRALVEASNPYKYSWQDNPWLYFGMGVIITVIGGLILKYVFKVI